MSRYQEQSARMRRRHSRFSEIRANISEQALTDDALAFFESRLHLRDWIKNDNNLPQAVCNAAFPYVKAQRALSQCHDIAIGAKHLTVDRPMAGHENPRLHPRRVVELLPADLVYGDDDDDPFLPPGYLVQTSSVRLMLQTNTGVPVDALAFAPSCVQEWDNFFDVHGLTK